VFKKILLYCDNPAFGCSTR